MPKKHIDAEYFRAWLLNQKRVSKYYTIQILDEIPAADVEEVVRCKDCKFRFSETCAFKHETADMDFCSCGAKKDGKENEDAEIH